MKSIKILTLALIATITFSSCSDDSTPPKPVVEEEVITTVEITLKNGSETVTLKSYDADGEGPGKPVITPSVGKLKQNTTYTGSIKLLNEMEKPAENITEEIKTEDKAHQFFYSSSKGLATFTYTDKDADGNPVGLTFTLTTAGTGNDKLTFTLRHTPIKTAKGVKEGKIANAGGSTDVEATFDVAIE